MLWCILQILSENVSHCKKNWATYERKRILVFTLCPLFSSDFKEKSMFPTEVRKILKYQFLWNPSGEHWVVPCERTDGRTRRQTDRLTDRHDEANSRFSQILWTRLKSFSKYCNIYLYSILNKSICYYVTRLEKCWIRCTTLRTIWEDSPRSFCIICSEKNDTDM
jgi:hypothetical protein